MLIQIQKDGFLEEREQDLRNEKTGDLSFIVNNFGKIFFKFYYSTENKLKVWISAFFQVATNHHSQGCLLSNFNQSMKLVSLKSIC